MEHPLNEAVLIWLYSGPGYMYMTKMAVMSMFGKKYSIFFSAKLWVLGCTIGDKSSIKSK